MRLSASVLSLALIASLCGAAGPSLPTVTVGLRKSKALEGGKGAQGKAGFTLHRTGDTTNALTVAFSLAGTARAGEDYTVPVTTATIPAGEASMTLVVTALDDLKAEGDETVVLTVMPVTSYQVGNPSSQTVTILDDEQSDAGNEGSAGGA